VLVMAIERFRGRDARAVYRRVRDEGRALPEGLTYVGSWIEASFDRCFQLVECDDARLLQAWALAWQGLVEFEFVPVVPSRETQALLAPLLDAPDPAPPAGPS
jgi:Protein of unknown function (DUF3303)